MVTSKMVRALMVCVGLGAAAPTYAGLEVKITVTEKKPKTMLAWLLGLRRRTVVENRCGWFGVQYREISEYTLKDDVIFASFATSSLSGLASLGLFFCVPECRNASDALAVGMCGLGCVTLSYLCAKLGKYLATTHEL